MADVRSVNQMLADTFEPKRQNRWYFQFAEDVLPQSSLRLLRVLLLLRKL